jgi:two-component system nitrogen regulation sensor histidine kinase NtrY
MASKPRRGRLGFELRLKLWVAGFALTAIVPLGLLVDSIGGTAVALIAGGAIALVWVMAAAIFFDQIVRPLQTLSNVVAALREDDFSFRAHGTRRGDAMGELALEINELASTLQQQRSTAQDALSLAERVMLTMASPVLVFDVEERLRLMNSAAERIFSLDRGTVMTRPAEELNLAGLLHMADEALFTGQDEGPVRWSVHRSAFRLHGTPHTLLVLTDVAALLREEERSAWQRLIRVLGHEINNSLTPIKSIAGSLQSRIVVGKTVLESEDFSRGLSVIEDRAASLNRFLQAYQRLLRVPQPRLVETALAITLERAAQLETRIPVRVMRGPEVMVMADPDLLQQMLINLVQNAVDAALSVERAGHQPEVELACSVSAAQAVISIRDNGPGLTNPSNLFVPFYTTKPNGTGIGLLLAQQISIGHHGSIRLINRRDGKGCEAEVRLPLLRT